MIVFPVHYRRFMINYFRTNTILISSLLLTSFHACGIEITYVKTFLIQKYIIFAIGCVMCDQKHLLHDFFNFRNIRYRIWGKYLLCNITEVTTVPWWKFIDSTTCPLLYYTIYNWFYMVYLYQYISKQYSIAVVFFLSN